MKNRVAILLIPAVLFANILVGGSHFRESFASASTLSNRTSESVEPPAKFALLVGINDYRNLPADQLSAPENDVAMLKDLLVKSYGFKDDNVHIKVLLSKQATKANIIDAFESQLIKNAEKNKNATVVFYYSGHGSQTADLNGDEGDGEDETIVPTDSRANGITDIIDDDIDEWFERLRLSTPNITFIIDSCHSGTITKAIDSGLKEKEIPPDTQPQPKQKALTDADKKNRTKDISNGILPRNESYVTISACLPEGKAREKWFDTPNGKASNSVLTHFLVEALKRKPDLTYRELGENLANEIDRSLEQHTQVEGDIGRTAFEGTPSREDPFVPLIAAASGKTLKIGAGAVHGVQVGTFIAVYKNEAKKLVGKENWISNATVTEVSGFSAVAEMPSAVAVPSNAKVSIVTPNFGTKRLRVALDPTGRSAFDASGLIKSVNPQNAPFIIGITSRVKDPDFSQLIELTPVNNGALPPGDSWDVALVQSTFGEIKNRLSPTTAVMPPTADSTTVYYLAQRDARSPLFNLWVTAETAGIDRLTLALRKKARQDNLKRLYNASSPLNGNIKVTVIRSTIQKLPSGAAEVKDEIRKQDQLGTCVFTLNENFRLKFENVSDQVLFVTLISLGTGGGISILSPGKRGVKINPHEGFTDGVPRPFVMLPPKGIETYKIIITTSQTDFRFLEQEGAKDLADYTPLDLLLDQANTGRRKDTGQSADPGLENWTAMQLSFEIR